MNPDHQAFLSTLVAGFYRDHPKESPSEWCENNLWFDEPDNRGPFSFAGREYAREMVDDWGDPMITDQVEVCGSQTGKTGTIMGGTAYTVINEPSRVIWVMPTRPLAQSFSRTRWMPMLRRSPATAELIPHGARRHDFASLQQQVGNSIIDFAGSNSPAAISSTPARVVVLDEVDKFSEGTEREADAVNLAEQRTKSFANPKRIKTSTPTMLEGLIWQEFLKTDQRRRFVPCPGCKKFVIFAWSKEYTVLPKTGHEAYVAWDKEAKRANGSWDLDRVDRSARSECPHCGFHIRDAHKTVMDRAGEWRPTASAARGYRGRHLPSLYASSVETTFGALARKFLQANNSLVGLQGFINGDLAEPYMSQDRAAHRVEIIRGKLEVTAEWRKLMTMDCQAKSPLFWYVIRAWNGNDSEGIEAGPLDTWEDARARQLANGVQDECVSPDSGFGAMSDSSVYRNCVRFGEFEERRGDRPLHLGWMPSKGMPVARRWRQGEGEILLPWHLSEVDPFIGSVDVGRVAMSLFEFSGDYFADILEAMRRGEAGFKWAVAESMATEEYWRHMDSEIKTAQINPKTGKTVHQWGLRSKHWPNHLKDCEKLQVALAAFFRLFELPGQ